MMRPRPLLLPGSLIGLILAVTGCERPVPIADLARHPDEYRGKEVRIHGRVISSYVLPTITRRGVYVVSDGSGQMGVLSLEGTPPLNSEVTAVGLLEKVPPVALPAVKRFRIAEVLLQEKEREVDAPPDPTPKPLPGQ